jgi:dihydroneopterin aldolase
MAILAMDQYAHLLASRVPAARLVRARDEIAVLDLSHVPVLEPSQWLRAADPLPHGWDVTSDTIAAWIAGQLGARHLVLVKPPGATGDLVDAHFARAVPPEVSVSIVGADAVAPVFSQLADLVTRSRG